MKLIFSPDDLIDGNLYQFEVTQSFGHSTAHSIIENCEFFFRFEGFQFGLFTFREIHGNWTVSLSSNQLIGKNIKEVILP